MNENTQINDNIIDGDNSIIKETINDSLLGEFDTIISVKQAEFETPIVQEEPSLPNKPIEELLKGDSEISIPSIEDIEFNKPVSIKTFPRYIGEFKDVNDNNWKIEIYKDGYIGEPEELLLGETPLIISYEDGGEIFKPVKYSGVSIKVLTPNILKDLYTGKILDVHIRIYRNGTIFWIGYNTPNIYNQEYWSQLDETTIEGIDCLSVLKYLKYPNNTNNVYSFYELIKMSLLSVYPSDLEKPLINYFNNLGNDGALLNFKCESANWINEDDNEKLSSVIESICQILGVQMYQYKDNIYIIDFDYKWNCKGELYNISTDTISIKELDFDTKVLEVAENNSNISYGDTYNQINVIANTDDYDDKVMDIISSDNSHLIDIAERVYNKRVMNLKNSDTSSDIITMYCKRDDTDISTPPTWQFTDNYNPWYAPIFITSPERSVFERYVKLDYKFDIISEADADTHKDIQFTNNLVFHVDSNCESMVVGSNSGEWSNLQSMAYYFDSKTPKRVFHYVSEPRKFSKGDWLILSFDLYYTTVFGTGFGLMTTDTQPTISDTSLTYSETNKYFKNNMVTGMIPFGIRTQIKLGDKTYRRTYNQKQWLTGDYYCDVCGKPIRNNESADSVFTVINNNTYTNRCSSSTQGLAIEITDDYYGPLEFSIYNAVIHPYNKSQIQAMKDAGQIGSGYKSQIWNSADNGESNAKINYVHIKDLILEHVPELKSEFWDFNQNQEKADLKYNAVIDANNVNEFNDLSVTLNTYNPDIYSNLSHSYLINSNNGYVKKEIKGAYICRPEQHLVQRYVSYYKNPKKKYSNTFYWNYDILPNNNFTTSYLNDIYKIGSCSIDVKYNMINVNGYEI